MIRFVEEAQREFLDAIINYEEARAGLGQRSRTRWTDASCGLKTILSCIACGRADIVASILRVFPYYIPYVVRGEIVWILAVAHASRKPIYWISRRNRVT
ncbi:MAG TPA: hypothetical protein VGH06_02480 [Candidatus Udaeobacter sp.]|jgi:hypothetical protein